MLKNSTLFYRELRQNCEQLRERFEKDETILAVLQEASETLIWLAEMAAKEGLLYLEEAAKGERVSGLILGNELWNMIDLVVDGTDTELVETISWKRYFARNYADLEGFLYLVYLDSALNIQCGEEMHRFRQEIAAFMPERICEKLLNDRR